MTKLNLGSGSVSIPGYLNLDGEIAGRPDVVAFAPPLPFKDGVFSDIVASHFLEHLERSDGLATLKECYRCLEPGGVIVLAVPNMRTLMEVYAGVRPPPGTGAVINGEPLPAEAHRDLDVVCHHYLYSTVQESRHKWSYDQDTLIRALGLSGFEWVKEWPVRSWWEVAAAGAKERPPQRGWERVRVH